MLENDTMPKVFNHDPKLYRSRVYGEGVVSFLALAFCVYKYLTTDSVLKILWVLVGVVSVYSFYRLLISRSTPEFVYIYDDRILFKGAGKNREFLFSDLSEFLIKEFKLNATQFIRIKTKKGKRCKYWIELKAYSMREQLESELLRIEEMIHPDELKATIKAHNKQFRNKRK